MTSPAMTRPPRVTTACLFVGMSCALLVMYVASALANWGSIEVQEQVAKVLADDSLKAQGWTVDDVMGYLRWALMLVAAVGATGIVFAIYTARGHQASRVIITVFCGLASVAFLLGGSLLGILPAAFSIFCGTYLWSADARQWFAVKNGKIDPAELAVEKPRPNPFADATPAQPEANPAQPAAQPVATAVQPRTQKLARPDGVLIGVLIAVIMSSMVVVVCGLNAAFYLISREEYLSLINDNAMMRDAVADSGVSAASFARLIFIVCSIATVLSLAAIAAAGAAVAGNPRGRSALVVLSAITIPVAIIPFPFGLIWVAAAIATLVLLRRPDSRAWFARS